MRAIAEPKYNKRVIATSGFIPVVNGERVYVNAVVEFKSMLIGANTSIKFYTDYLNSGLMRKEDVFGC